MYLRLFPRHSTRMQCFAVGFVVILWGLAITSACAVTCLPVSKVWNPARPGKCIDLTALYYGAQIPNIITDALLILIPIKPISVLKLPSVQKRALYVVFGLGTL
jgi:hypothetical protein